jgi:hypothetical protein
MDVRPMVLGSSGTSMFSQDRFAGRAQAPARIALGQTGQVWYTRAKAAIIKYDTLLSAAYGLSDPTEKQGIIDSFASAGAQSTAAAVRGQTLSVEGQSPLAYGVFDDLQAQQRVQDLEQIDRDFEAAVKAAQDAQKSNVAAQQQQSAPSSKYLPVALAGGIALVIGAIVLASE